MRRIRGRRQSASWSSARWKQAFPPLSRVKSRGFGPILSAPGRPSRGTDASGKGGTGCRRPASGGVVVEVHEAEFAAARVLLAVKLRLRHRMELGEGKNG